MNFIKLNTYEEVSFEVDEKWLLNQIDMPIEEFLSEYTYDDSEYLLRLAKEQNKVNAIYKMTFPY